MMLTYALKRSTSSLMLDPKKQQDPLTELDTFLKKHPDVELVHVILTDPVGIQRGKGLRPHEL